MPEESPPAAPTDVPEESPPTAPMDAPTVPEAMEDAPTDAPTCNDWASRDSIKMFRLANGKRTSCELEREKPATVLKRRCTRNRVLTNCPQLCGASSCAHDDPYRFCNNHPDQFRHDGGLFSCEKLAKLKKGKRKEECKKPKVREYCPGVCTKRKCPCEDWPAEFTVRQDNKPETYTCEQLLEVPQPFRRMKCTQKAFKKKCPTVCLLAVCSNTHGWEEEIEG